MLRLNNLETAVSKIHSYFDEWGNRHAFNNAARHDSTLHEARLAAHEWTANLVQHADFEGRRPFIALDLQKKGNAIECVIIDNSEGFNLEEKLRKAFEKNRMEAMPERGMGLLMLHTCAADLSYENATKGRHRLVFLVAPNGAHSAEPTSDGQVGPNG